MNRRHRPEKILIISILYSPDTRVGAKRFSFLSNHFQKKYPELHVLTLKEKHIPKKDASLSGSGMIHRAGMLPPHPLAGNNIFKRIFKRLWEDYLCLVDPFSGWILPAFFKGLKIIRTYHINLIIVTGPPFSPMVVGLLLNLVTKARLILDYRDPWTNHNWGNKKAIRKKFNRLLERWTVRRASALVFCSGIMKENFENSLGKFACGCRNVITNGFYDRTALVPLQMGNGGTNMIYAGNFYGERKIELLLKPLLHLKNQGTISKDTFHCHVFGALTKTDHQQIKAYGLEEIIREQPRVPYEEVLRYLKGADILFLPSGSEFGYAIPFKFFDYLSVKRPILAVAPEDSAVAEIMNQIDCGRLTFIKDGGSIEKGLNMLISDKNRYSFSGADRFLWDRIAEKYLSVLEGLER